jgi:hypothetical protein
MSSWRTRYATSSAAMSALSFVTSAVNETAYISNEEFKVSLQDTQIISSESSFH